MSDPDDGWIDCVCDEPGFSVVTDLCPRCDFCRSCGQHVDQCVCDGEACTCDDGQPAPCPRHSDGEDGR